MSTRSGARPTGEPRLASAASWAVLVASFGLSASTWVALAAMSGFDGRLGGFRLAWLMPVAVDGYVVTALVLWMSPVPAKVAAFAKKNTYGAASVGVAAQSAFHALTVYSATSVEWRGVMAAVVGAIPPGVAALAVHMRALVRRESGQAVAGSAATERQLERPPVAAPTATVADTAPAITPDTAPAIAAPGPAMPAAAKPAVKRPQTRPVVAGPPANETAAKVAKVAAKMPDAPAAKVAAKVGISERTARRYLADIRPATPAATTPVNGAATAGLLTQLRTDES